MKEEAKVTFYQIEKCGYYKKGAETPECGDVPATLAELANWVKLDNKPLSETCPFQIVESDSAMRVFCYDIRKHPISGDTLVTTWNETPATEGSVAAVNGNQPVGSADIVFQKLPKDAIPGFATYFWFLNELNAFATIRFQHPLNGHLGLARFLREFLAKFTKHVIKEIDAENEVRIVGYHNADKPTTKYLSPQYYSSLLRKPGKIEFLRKNRQKINKLIRKNCLQPTDAEEMDLLQKVLMFAGLKKPSAPSDPIHFKHEMTFKPSEEELNEVISHWQGMNETKWDDVGFRLSKDPTTHWLSHAFVKDVFEIDVERENAEIIAADSLLSALQQKRAVLLNLARENPA